MSAALLAVLLALGVFLIGLARLIPNPTAARMLDVAGTVLAGLVLLVDVLTLHT